MASDNSGNPSYTSAVNTDQSTAPRPRRTYDPTDNKGRGYKNSYAIYPDYWKPSWGPKPLLGYVRADSVFHARYAAYDAHLLPVNFTFGPDPVLQVRKPFNPALTGNPSTTK